MLPLLLLLVPLFREGEQGTVDLTAAALLLFCSLLTL